MAGIRLIDAMAARHRGCHCEGMYLVHLHLRPAGTSPVRDLPDRIDAVFRAAARAEDGVEHVVVHGEARPYPVLGAYLIADRLEDAEASAARVWERARASFPGLADWAVVEARVPLIASFYDDFCAGPAPPRSLAESGQDRFRPPESPSQPGVPAEE
jgi:hypothetical protein